jgi:hypothetical protein
MMSKRKGRSLAPGRQPPRPTGRSALSLTVCLAAQNDEAFVVIWLAYIIKYKMIDTAAKWLCMDPQLIKRWVQDNRGMLDSVMSYRAEEILNIYNGLS